MDGATKAKDKISERASLIRLRLGNNEFLIPLLLFLISLVLRVLTAARTVTFSDSGDFLMGIATVGNVHGPGYPLYLITAKIFCLLFPFGSLAFRASLYSAIFASLSSSLIYLIVLRMTRNRVGGVVAALAFSFSYTFWYQTVIPETYGLNSFFIALIILLLLRWEKLFYEGRQREAINTLCIAAFVFGLSLTNHFSVIFLLPAFLFFIADTDWKSALTPKSFLRLIAFVILGTLAYIYQPAAAFRGPGYNYADPSTLRNWFRLVTLYYQRGGLFSYPLAYFGGRLWRYFGTLNTEFPYIAWLGAIGIISSFRKRTKKYPVFLIFLFILSLLPVMTYMQFESILRAHFYYPSYMIFSIWIGIGVSYIGRLIFSWVRKRDRTIEIITIPVATVLAVLLVVPAIAVHYDKVDKSNYYFAEDVARKMLEYPEKGSIIVEERDNYFFPCRYMQVVEKYRTDIRVISAQSIGGAGFQGLDLLTIRTPENSGTSELPRYAELIEKNYRNLPIYFGDPTYVQKEWKLAWCGYLLRVYPPDQSVSLRKPQDISIRNDVSYKDSDAREALLIPQALLASIYYNNGEYEKAEAIYKKILSDFEKNTYVQTLYGNVTASFLYKPLGTCLIKQKKFKEAIKTLRHAARIYPDSTYFALVQAFAQLGETGEALIELDKIIAFNAEEPEIQSEAMTIQGELYINAERYKEAVDVLEKSIEKNPKSARARYVYGRALLLLGRDNEAKKQFEKAIELEPDGPYAKKAQKELDSIEQK